MKTDTVVQEADMREQKRLDTERKTAGKPKKQVTQSEGGSKGKGGGGDKKKENGCDNSKGDGKKSAEVS